MSYEPHDSHEITRRTTLKGAAGVAGALALGAGATSGIVEMLLQSQYDVVEVLPALPAAWPAGSVRGLRARGGATVDVEWARGRATRIALKASRTRELTVRSDLFEEGQLTFRAVAGRRYTWSGQG